MEKLIEINTVQVKNTTISFTYFWSDKGFKSTVVNRVLPSLLGGGSLNPYLIQP